MIFLEDKMQYTNVYTKKINCMPDEVKYYISDFWECLDKAGVRRKESFFYSFNSLSEGVMEIQLFQPAEKYRELIDVPISYMSYFYIDHMISTLVLEEFKNIADKYGEVMEFMEEHGLISASNTYNEVHITEKQRYLVVKVAVI